MTQIATLLQRDFYRLSAFIQNEYGIKMPDIKKTLLESRLQKRLRSLEIKTFKDYCDYLFSPEGMTVELPHFIDKITTNKTDFFRENEHFDYLTSRILPSIIGKKRGEYNTLRIWSAGCSTGEEPYTLGMVVKDYLETNRISNFRLSILATDISHEVLRVAQRAIYHEMRAVPIPFAIKKKYLLRSKSGEKKLIKIAPEIRELVQFGRLNFMDNEYGIKEKMDIVFCRNVIIYFDKATQEVILNRIIRNLTTGGFFFQGHSETTQGIELPLRQVFPTVYVKTN
jgi:chemotaxis protein methyltransferase CheR